MATTGPDRIIKTDDLSTWDRDGAVRLRIRKEDAPGTDPLSIISFVKKNCQLGGNSPAMMVKRDGQWVQWTYTQFYTQVRTAAKALIKLGLERYNAVSIFGFNAPEWHISCLASIFGGGFSCGLYPTNSAEMNKFIMQDSMTNILIVEDEASLNKIWSGAQEVESLKTIIQFSGIPKRPGVLSWAEFMKIGQDETDEALDATIKTIAINQCAVLIYTSGTTGNPKAVMLSHDNITYTTRVGIEMLHWRPGQEIIISYLPLSHIAGQIVDLWAPMGSRATVYFADKMALKGSLLATLTEVRPTQFFGVPRVWEKIMEGMQEKAKAITGLKKKIGTACKEAGLQHNLEGKTSPVYKIGQKIYYCKVREALGLDRCVKFYTAAAPIGPETMRYFMSLNIVIQELYGMSETTGPHHVTMVDKIKIGSVGRVMDSCKSRLANPSPEGEGELCMWGRNIMMGYMNREDKTTEDLDPEGWLHSGDLATADSDGFYFITGRKFRGEKIKQKCLSKNVASIRTCTVLYVCCDVNF